MVSADTRLVLLKQFNDITLHDTFRYRGSYMSAHVLLNLLNELGKRDKMRGLAEHFISFSQRV